MLAKGVDEEADEHQAVARRKASHDDQADDK